MPENPAERAQVRQWTKLVDEEIHDAGSVLSFCAMFRDRMLAADEEDREKRFRNVGNPSSAQAHYALGWAMIWGGRATEAISHVETAMRLSPHDPYFGQFLVRMSEANLVARRPEEAIDWARRSLRQPNTQTSRWVMLAVALAHTGRIEEARQAVESLQRLAPGYDVTLARDIFRFGDPETRDYFLDGLRKAGLPE